MTQRERIVVVTGEIGAGKTTYCRQQIDAAWRIHQDVAGVLSPARFEHGDKVGIDALDLRSGEMRPLAHLRTPKGQSGAETIVTQRWRFEPETLSWVNQILMAATPCDLLVVDELGPLELEQARGWTAALDAVATRAFATALIVVRDSLLTVALTRWPDAEVVQIKRPV